ncbi:hypothetical protein HPP92_000357 [Vanilla planifolia]|uniref:Uncharacterized protein n=1 Tax=Vanilla planifolia TaxID=51239 RepID=A0A835RP10_VANPL|nr:hypothetical protein HPP92_000357 [Vanilla planifolia]
MLEAGKLSRASSSQCLKAKEIQSRSRTESEMVEARSKWPRGFFSDRSSLRPGRCEFFPFAGD